MSYNTLQLRGDTAANWEAANPILAAREIGLVVNAQGQVITIKFGDGATAWAALPAFIASGVAPAGTEGLIQFLKSGGLGADVGLKWDEANQELILGGDNTGITMKAITNEPPAPAANHLHWYSKKIAGKLTPKCKGPSGMDFPLQTALWQNNVCLWSPTTATAGLWLGTAGAGAGTYSTALPTVTNIYTAMKRARWANVATTANQVLGQRNTEAMFFRGNAPGQGGFFFYARCGMDAWTNGGRFFGGMHSATTVVSADPSALANTCGFAVDAGDAGAISFLTRDASAAKKAATGFSMANNTGFDLFMFCAPNSSEIHWRIVNLLTGAEASGTATTNLPVNTVMLTAGVLASNAALTPVTSINLGVNRIYVETDF